MASSEPAELVSVGGGATLPAVRLVQTEGHKPRTCWSVLVRIVVRRSRRRRLTLTAVVHTADHAPGYEANSACSLSRDCVRDCVREDRAKALTCVPARQTRLSCGNMHHSVQLAEWSQHGSCSRTSEGLQRRCRGHHPLRVRVPHEPAVLDHKEGAVDAVPLRAGATVMSPRCVHACFEVKGLDRSSAYVNQCRQCEAAADVPHNPQQYARRRRQCVWGSVMRTEGERPGWAGSTVV